MLKKIDLAKQFELLTLQEIKNYQDSLNFILQTIKGLRDEIELLKQDSLENYASIHSVQCGLEIEINNHKENLNELKAISDRANQEQRLINERNSREMLDISDAVHRKIRTDFRFDERFDELNSRISEVKQAYEKTNQRLSDSADDLLRRFSNDISKTKREIMDAPTEASLVRNELEQKIYAHKVDVSGIMKELTVFKKENVVIEKKLENIYTLIERLQKQENK